MTQIKKFILDTKQNKIVFDKMIEYDFDKSLFDKPILVDLSKQNSLTFIINETDLDLMIEIFKQSLELYNKDHECQSLYDYLDDLVNEKEVNIKYIFE